MQESLFQPLYLAIPGKSALIPWNELATIGFATLYWRKAPMPGIGHPTIATITVPLTAFEQIQRLLPAAMTAARLTPE